MHLVGASTSVNEEKTILVMKARATLIRDHWSAGLVPFGVALMWLWAGLRRALTAPLGLVPGPAQAQRAARWKTIWTRRGEWLTGYRGGSD